MNTEPPNPDYKGCDNCVHFDDSEETCILRRCIHAVSQLKECYVPKQTIKSTPSTIYGYHLEHLVTIAMVLQKENLPPERVAEVLNDASRIVKIVSDEFEKTLMGTLRKEITK